MSLGVIATKRRIRSVNSTRKITKAMELVSTSKLKRTKDVFEKISAYTDETYSFVQNVLANISLDTESKYLKKSTSSKELYIVITSNLGLCGGYNSNVINLAKKVINKDNDKVIIVGSKGLTSLKKLNYDIVKSYEIETGKESEVSKMISNLCLEMYLNDEVSKIHLIYTKFVNSLTFVATDASLFPVDLKSLKSEEKSYKSLQIEPNASEVLDYLLPFYFNSVLYGKIMESAVSEQASRRTAMENATDNADEISAKLLIDYNKARQAAITQEITEVVAGANASS